jgi:hypothetical protein
MKKLLMLSAIAGSLFLASCGNDDEGPSVGNNSRFDEVLTGNLTTRTLDANKKYLLSGQVFVPNGVTVTIPAGTKIFGEKRTRATLVVDVGGKLEVNGTAQNPVVMTSAQAPGERDRGDWGGLVILGTAFTNQPSPAIEGIEPEKLFGRLDRNDDGQNSGTYRYLRVEYAGIELTPNNETNSITMGGVGRGTTMEYCMVSFGGDDGFEWFGGTINGKYLISHSTWDDDFDCDYGWSGNVQFGLIVRNPFFADQSQSNAFEMDNGPNDNDTELTTSVSGTSYTTGTFSNVTVYGPRDRTGRSISGNNVHSIDLRRRVAASIFNSVIGGFPSGLRMNGQSVYDQYVGESPNGVLENNVLYFPGAADAATVFIGSGASSAQVREYWLGTEESPRNSLVTIGTEDAPYTELGLRAENFFARYTQATYPSNPNFSLLANGSLATGALFSNAKFNESNRTTFFDKTVTYRGAFSTTDWTDGWAEFNPLNIEY